MHANVGDQIIVRGHHVGDGDRHGEVIEIHGTSGTPPYVVRWSDGHEALFFPGSDAAVEERQATR